MKRAYVRRRVIALLIAAFGVCFVFISQQEQLSQTSVLSSEQQRQYFGDQSASEALATLPVKGRAPKTGYQRAQFGSGWSDEGGLCDTRNIIPSRDLVNAVIDNACRMQSGVLNDPYTGKAILFRRGESTSQLVQIDHVVALSDAWQKGAQQLSYQQRIELANDPLNLLAVSGEANQQKSDGDATTWLPANRAFRCQYVARQVAVKQKYSLWVTESEGSAMKKVLSQCSS